MSSPKCLHHYALESLPTIFDEEALTVLQLCGRIAAKVNEVIRAFGELDEATAGAINGLKNETIPEEVANRIQALIDGGKFDEAINLYCGDLRARLNNILANGSPDKDPELVDARMDHRGYLTEKGWSTLGEMLRFWLAEFEYTLESIITWQTTPVPLSMTLGYVNTSGEFVKENLATHKCATVEVVPGQRFRVKTSYGYNMPSFVVQDANHYPIMYGKTNDDGTVHCNYEEVVTMPTGAAYLIINSMNGYFCGLQEVIGVNSNALDGDYITNALSGVLAGPLNQPPVPERSMQTAHALKNGEVMPLDNGDTSHRVVRYNVQPGRAYNLRTAASFGCNPYVFRNAYGSIIGKLEVAPEDTVKEYDVKVRAPIGAVEMFCYFTGGYETKLTMDNGCIVKGSVAATPNAPGYPDWSHLKWYAMGDSLTERNSYATKHYYDYIQEKTGIQVIVDGVGGSGYLAGNDRGVSFLDRVGNIPTDVDVVTIFGSGNDLQAMGKAGISLDEPPTFIKETLDRVMEANPQAKLIVLAPTPWKGYATDGMEIDAGLNMDLLTYCNNLWDTCDYIGLNCILDNHNHPPFNPNDENHLSLFFSTDPVGVHPDENGHRALAPIFYNALLSVLACK